MLEDERWERKSFEYLESRGWRCEECGDRAVNVHHRRYYKPRRKPWEYSDVDLEALCRLCHMQRHRNAIPHTAIEDEKWRADQRKRRATNAYFRKRGWPLPTDR